MDKMTKKIDKVISQVVQLTPCIGYQMAIFNDKEIVYKKQVGHDNLKKKIKTSDYSMYMIGSNTKIFTAISIFQLYEENKLSLDDDIRLYIPEFSIKSLFEYEKITIKDLLNHRSGITSDLYNLIFDEKRNYHDVIDELKDTYLTSKPSEMFSYSNVGYTLLGIIIERISKIPYEKYIKENICKKLDINIEFLKTDEEKEKFDNLSLCYNFNGKPIKDHVSTLIPAGSNTYIKLLDFVKFGQVFLNKGYPLLKESTYELMLQLDLKEEIDNELINVGYGLFHNEYTFGDIKKTYGHGGDTQCHHSMFLFIPEQNIGVIVLTNTESAAGFSRSLGIAGLSVYLGEKGCNVPRRLSCKHQYIETDCSKYVGKYMTSTGILDIKLNKKGRLVTSIQKIKVELLACSDGYFQCNPLNPLIWLLLRKTIRSVRFKFINYFNQEVVLLEQTQFNQKAKLIIGTKYIDTNLNDSWESALGVYEDPEHKCKITLLKEKENIKMIINAVVGRKNIYIWIYNDNLAVTQGFGRETKEVVELEKIDNDLYIKVLGLKGKKKVK